MSKKTPQRPHQRASSGFTLVEMVVAATIFVVISMASYAAINNVLNSRERINETYESLTELQRVYALLKNDILYMQNRSIRDEFGIVEEAFVSINSDELFRLTTLYPGPNQTASSKRIVWEFSDGSLWRKEYETLDRGSDDLKSQRRLLSGVDQVNVFFYSYDVKTGTIDRRVDWNLQGTQGTIPVALEVEIELEGQEIYRWLFAGANL